MLDFNHIYSVLATSILETISPTRCAVCDEPGEVLCATCASELPFIDHALACPRCGAPFGALLCTECPNPGSEEERIVLERLAEQGATYARRGQTFPFAGARAALSFEGGAKSIVRLYKDGDELRLDAVIASLICEALRGKSTNGDGDDWSKSTSGDTLRPTASKESAEAVPDWSLWANALVYVPASPEAVLRRDFDHMERVAKLCGEQTGLPVLRALESCKGTLDQRELGRAQRIANRSESFVLANDAGELPARIVLIDDVFTTGATMTAAARVLLDAGVHEIRCVAFARVW